MIHNFSLNSKAIEKHEAEFCSCSCRSDQYHLKQSSDMCVYCCICVLCFSRTGDHAVTGFLQYLSTVCQQSLVQKLVVGLLQVCPGQLPGFVGRLVQQLSPRPQPRWAHTVAFLCKVN